MTPNQIRDAINKADVVRVNDWTCEVKISMCDMDFDAELEDSSLVVLTLGWSDGEGQDYELNVNIRGLNNAKINGHTITMEDEHGDLFDMGLYILTPILLVPSAANN